MSHLLPGDERGRPKVLGLEVEARRIVGSVGSDVSREDVRWASTDERGVRLNVDNVTVGNSRSGSGRKRQTSCQSINVSGGGREPSTDTLGAKGHLPAVALTLPWVLGLVAPPTTVPHHDIVGSVEGVLRVVRRRVGSPPVEGVLPASRSWCVSFRACSAVPTPRRCTNAGDNDDKKNHHQQSQ